MVNYIKRRSGKKMKNQFLNFFSINLLQAIIMPDTWIAKNIRKKVKEEIDRKIAKKVLGRFGKFLAKKRFRKLGGKDDAS